MSTLFTGARLLTVDADFTEIEDGWLLVANGRIAGLGAGRPPEGTVAGETVDVGGDLLMPGMVNSHCHMAMTLFRGLGEDVDDRLYRYILPIERDCVTEPVVAAGSALAAIEMIRGGVTTVADMYYFETAVGEAIARSGMRGVVGQTLADFAAPDHRTFDEAFARADALVATFAGHPRVTASIAPHAPYSTGPAVMERVARWAADHPGVPVQMHLAETVAERDGMRRDHGLSSVGLVDRCGLLRPGLVAAHCLFVDDADMDLLAARGVGVAHNPRSNGKAGRGIAPVTAMRARGIAVGIASDGAMSGNTLDLFAQLAPASMFQKLAAGSRKPLPARDAVRMVTIEAARALGMADRIGSLEVGKAADILRLSLAEPRLHPIYDTASMLVFAALPSDVVDVMVGGDFLMRGRRMLTLDPADVLAHAREAAATFRARIDAIDAAQR